MIQFQNVYKTYSRGINAVEDVTFQIDEGEFVFLIGSSGSGKTTLIKMLIREEKPSEGRIFFDNEDITELSRSKVYQHRRRIGVIFQDYKLIEEKTAYENLEFVMEAAGKSHKEIKETVPYLLDIVGLANRSNAFPRELSGGEKQRVAIARALVNNPKLLIADEPTGNLDPEAAWDIVRILQKINDWGTTILMSTHGLDIVEKVGKRVLRIDEGILQDDYIDGYKTSTQKSKESFEKKLSGDIEEETKKVKITQDSKNKSFQKKHKNELDSETKENLEEKEDDTNKPEDNKQENSEKQESQNSSDENDEEQPTKEDEDDKTNNEEDTEKKAETKEKPKKDKDSTDKEEKESNKNKDKSKEPDTEEIKKENKKTKDDKAKSDKKNEEEKNESKSKAPKLKISLVDKKPKHPLGSKNKKSSDEESDLNKLDLPKEIIEDVKEAGYKDIESVIEAGIKKISKVDSLNKKDVNKIKKAVAKFIKQNS